MLETSETTLKEPELSLKFSVKSKKPLKRVEVTSGAKVLFTPKAEDLATLKPNAQGYYEFNTGNLTVEWGLNQLRVEAVNDGGPASKSMVVTVPTWPVQIDLDQIAVEEAKMETVTPTRDAAGKVIFPKTSDGRVTLMGKIRWSSKDDANLNGPHGAAVRQRLPAIAGHAAARGKRRAGPQIRGPAEPSRQGQPRGAAAAGPEERRQQPPGIRRGLRQADARPAGARGDRRPW